MYVVFSISLQAGGVLVAIKINSIHNVCLLGANLKLENLYSVCQITRVICIRVTSLCAPGDEKNVFVADLKQQQKGTQQTSYLRGCVTVKS